MYISGAFLCPPRSAGLGVVNMVKSAMQRLLGGHSKETHKKAIDQFWILDKDVRHLAVPRIVVISKSFQTFFSFDCYIFKVVRPSTFSAFLISQADGELLSKSCV